MSSRKRDRSVSPRRKVEHDGDSDSDGGRRRSHREKRHGSKKRSRRHQRSDSNNDDEESRLASGVQEISEDDYYAKSSEFRLWLREEKDKYFNELSSDRARRYFRKFVRAWNAGKLNKKFYEGVRSSQLDSSSSTRHKWNIRMNQDEIDAVKHSVDRQTNTHFATEVTIRSAARAGVDNPAAAKGKRVMGPTMPPSSGVRDEEMDAEDRERYERSLHRQDRKEFAKKQEVVLEELAPRATGREAMIEKKKSRNAYYRREASPDVELDDKDLMDDNDFQSRLTARSRVQEAREQRRQERQAEKATNMREKMAAYQSKEQATMDMFRQMAEEQRRAGGGLWNRE